MKTILLVLGILTLVLTGLVVWSGYKTDYKYLEASAGTETTDIHLEDFVVSIMLGSRKGNEVDPSDDIAFTIFFSKPSDDITINSVKVKAYSDSATDTFELQSVQALDGFYQWEEEKNGEAKSFKELPSHLKSVSKDIEAYYAYSWTFNTANHNINSVNVSLEIDLSSNGKELKIKENKRFKLNSELIFRNPIRFH